MRTSIVLIIFMLSCARAIGQHGDKDCITPADSMIAGILQGVNLKRSIYSERPLLPDDTLNKLAQAHSEAMASGSIPLGHDGTGKRSAVIQEKWGKDVLIGENVTEAGSAEEAVEQWWESEGHKSNMLGDYTATGIGVAQRGENWYCTQIFVRR